MAILGVDEVGRGAWAGPLVVGACVLGGVQIEGLKDSKLLTKKRREELEKEILEKVKGVGLGWVSAAEVDEVGLSESLRLATRRAVSQIKAPYHEIIIDGTVNFLAGTNKSEYVTTMKKADLLVPAVSAASIVAKVGRDRYMSELDAKYEGYGFSGHVGYGTARHMKALGEFGVTDEHRMSVKPVGKIAGITRMEETGKNVDGDLRVSLTTKAVGDKAEGVVCEYLVREGHVILDRNWRTRWCEIDIVSARDGTVYFTEVKYRNDDKHGGGLGAITKTKLEKMERAARMYVLREGAGATDMRLAVASVGGDFAIRDFLVL